MEDTKIYMIILGELPQLLMKSKIKYEVSSPFSSNYCGGTAIDILLGHFFFSAI